MIQIFSHMPDFCVPFRPRHCDTLLKGFQNVQSYWSRALLSDYFQTSI
jgi:hypothetical protein